MSRADEDFECETCFGQSFDVQLRHDPQDKSSHIYICDDCLEEKQSLADYLENEEAKRDET